MAASNFFAKPVPADVWSNEVMAVAWLLCVDKCFIFIFVGRLIWDSVILFIQPADQLCVDQSDGLSHIIINLWVSCSCSVII